jgi:acyl dehydratase
MTLDAGSRYSHEYSFTQEDVEAFARLTGDCNPIHLEEEYANRSIFKRRIMHGFLSASVFSKILGTKFPCEGSIYLTQNIDFLKPMFCDTKYRAEFEIEKVKKNNIVFLRTTIKDLSDDIKIKGNAVIKIPE